MGHANLTNISNFFIRRLYEKGRLSISDCVTQMAVAECWLHASEGEYKDRPMMSYGVEQVVCYLSGNLDGVNPPQPEEIIVPADPTPEQLQIIEKWRNGTIEEWEAADDEGNASGEWALFWAIEWKYGPGWRKQYPKIPHLCNVSN